MLQIRESGGGGGSDGSDFDFCQHIFSFASLIRQISAPDKGVGGGGGGGG